MISRRGLFSGLLMAPAIVQATSLMPLGRYNGREFDDSFDLQMVYRSDGFEWSWDVPSRGGDIFASMSVGLVRALDTFPAGDLEFMANRWTREEMDRQAMRDGNILVRIPPGDPIDGPSFRSVPIFVRA